VNKHAHRYHPLTGRNYDWLLRTDAERLMQLLGQGRVRDNPSSWLLPPPTPLKEPEIIQPVISVTSSAPADWRGRRRRLAPVRRSANDDMEADRETTNVEVSPSSRYSQSEVQLPSVAGYETAASAASTTRSSPGVEHRQPFPSYPPLLGRIFPTMSSTSSSLLSSSLAYEMLATAALSSLRHASLLPPSSTSYDVISAAAAAAALLQPHSAHFSPFVAPQATVPSLGRPEVDRGERVSAGSVLDLVVAPSQSDTTAAGNDRGATDMTIKHSPCRRDSNGDQLSAVAPKARCCVWRPY